MSSSRLRIPFSPLTLSWGLVSALSVVYAGLIALIMSSAVLTIEFSHSIKDNEAAVASLEAHYLASVAAVALADYRAAGYAIPPVKRFVTAENVAALR